MELKSKLDFKVPQMAKNKRTIRGVSKAIQDAMMHPAHTPSWALSTNSENYEPLLIPHRHLAIPGQHRKRYVRHKWDWLSVPQTEYRKHGAILVMFQEGSPRH